MTQDYEQEINLIDLLGYMICRWKCLVVGLILGGLLGGAISFCTPQHVIDEKYDKANPKMSEEDINGIKLLYDNFQLLQQEQKNTQEELESLRQLKDQKKQAEELQQQIAEKEQQLIERTVAVSEYLTKNIRVLIGDQKAYYEALVQGNGKVEEVSDELQRSEFRTQQYRKTIIIGIFAGVFLILLGIGASYLLGNKIRTGEDFAIFSNSILLADFSAISKDKKTDVLTKWGYKIRGMDKTPAEDVMLFASEYAESLIAKEGVKTLYIVTDSEMIGKTSDKDNEMLTDKTSDKDNEKFNDKTNNKDNAKYNSRTNSKTNLEAFQEKMQSDTLQIITGNFMSQPEKFEDMNQADGVLLWVCRDRSKHSSWEGILTALNALEKKVIGTIVE